MAAQRLTLHLDPVRSAENLLIVIDAMARRPEKTFRSFADVLAFVREDYDYTDRTEPLSLALLLGLLTEADEGIGLSCVARAIATLRPAIRADLMHFLLATAWRTTNDARLACSWTYREFCDQLWARGSATLSAIETKQIVADLLGSATATFPEQERAALSPKSVLGMRKWLTILEPSVLVGDQFCRREVCSSELLVLAIAHVAAEDGADLTMDLPMSPTRRAAISRLCLLEPSVLDRGLDRAMAAFPAFIEPGTRTGAHGRFIRLKAAPAITAFSRG